MPGTDPVSVAGAKDKIVLLDTQGIGFFGYQDLMNFSTAFRRFYGACPREYRRMKNRS